MTGLCTYGGAQKAAVKGCPGGMLLIQNKLTVINEQNAHIGTALGRGVVCATTKIMP